ncbi:hypothetical protein [Pseudomonas caricapapayae]|uniref:hypothetical protein n=1 Tax=Pseudomonas caricapapayae TaxID=46678 RepID=UPI000F00608F|nr:hypothetical protein [Pseudomonas caricapapayae]
MKSLILSLLFFLSLCSTQAFADTDVESWSVMHPQGFNTASKNLEANYNEYERKQALAFPLLESVLGCNIVQDIRSGPVDYHWFFTGDYKCLGASNQFNTDNWRLFLGPVFMLVKFFSFIFAGLIIRIPLTWIFELMINKAQSEEDKQNSKPSDTVTNVILLFFVIVSLIPLYKSDKEKDADVNIMMMTTYTTIAWSLQAGNTILNKLVSNQVIEQPYVKIPVAANQRTKDFLTLVDFFMCTKQQPGTNNTSITFNRSEGHFSAFKQIGKCTLSIDHEIDEGTINAASLNGLPDLYNLEVEALTEAYTNAFAEANDLATKLSNHVDLPQDMVGTAFDTKMSCEAIKSYDLGKTDKVGMSQYVYKAGNCMGDEFITRLTRAPGVSITSETKEQDRWVQFCQTSKNMADLESTQKACAEKMCGSDSSPFMCSAQINNYVRLLGNRYLTDPNYVTMFGQFMKTKYGSSNFSKPGNALINSMQIESNQSNDYLESTQAGKPAFTIPVAKSTTTQERLWTTAAIMGAFNAETSMNLDTFGMLNKYFTIGNDGPLGMTRTKECILYPNQKSPSGRVCASVYKEFDLLGNRLMAAASELIAGTKAAKIMYSSPTERAVEKAGVDMALATMKESSKMFGGNSGMVAFMAAATVNQQVNDIFSEYGSDFGPEAAYMIALVYTNPDVAEFASSVGKYMWGMGMYLKFSIPIAYCLIIIMFFITMFNKTTASTIASVPHFILLLGKNKKTMDPNTDVWKPIETIIVQTVSWTLYGGVIFIGLGLVDALFMYQAIPFSVFENIYTGSANANSLVKALDDALLMALYVVLLSFIIGACIKTGPKMLTGIVRTWIYGQSSEAPRYEQEDEDLQSKNEI